MKQLLLILSVVLVFLSFSLLYSKEEPLKIITSKNVYSFKQSSRVETFKIPILMNKKDTYYTNKEYISSISIKSKDEQIPLSISNIEIGEKIEINSISYYMVTLYLQIDFQSEDYLIQFDDCHLQIEYVNDVLVNLFIGEFNYIFDESDTKLLLGNLKATVLEQDNKKTISGIHVELFNDYSDNIVIKDVQILSNSIRLNNDYSIKVYNVIDMFDSVEATLNLKQYPNKSKQVLKNEYVVRENQSIELYIPTTFLSDYQFIHRCVIQIVYEMDGEIDTLYLDDLPYISTSIFTEEYEDGFYYYEY